MGQTISPKIIYVYRKQTESLDALEVVLRRIFPAENIEYTAYTDAGIDFIALWKMKRDITRNDGGVVVISSAKVLGISSDDVLRELLWMQQNNVILVAMDANASQTLDQQINGMILQTLIDVYRSMPSSNVTHFQSGVGRKRIVYPENWNELYDAWEDGSITAKEFMEQAGLKKGTFYHLAASYRAQLDSIKEIRKIG